MQVFNHKENARGTQSDWTAKPRALIMSKHHAINASYQQDHQPSNQAISKQSQS